MIKKFNVKPVCDTASKCKARTTLPYLGKSSEVLRTQLKELFKKEPCCSIQRAFTINCGIGNLSRFKDKLPSSLRSKIVHFFKCSRCNSTYIGVTKRHQKVRFSEHIGISPRTSKALKPTSVNASKIKEHILMNQHTGMLYDFIILLMRDVNEFLEIICIL